MSKRITIIKLFLGKDLCGHKYELPYALRYDHWHTFNGTKETTPVAIMEDKLAALNLQGVWGMRIYRESGLGYYEYYLFFQHKNDQMLVRMSLPDVQPVRKKLKD